MRGPANLPKRGQGPRDLEQAKALSAGFGDAMAEGEAARKLAEFTPARCARSSIAVQPPVDFTGTTAEFYNKISRDGIQISAIADRWGLVMAAAADGYSAPAH